VGTPRSKPPAQQVVSANQWIDITGLSSGRYRLRAIADPANWLAETNNANNSSKLTGAGVRVVAYGARFGGPQHLCHGARGPDGHAEVAGCVPGGRARSVASDQDGLGGRPGGCARRRCGL